MSVVKEKYGYLSAWADPLLNSDDIRIKCISFKYLCSVGYSLIWNLQRTFQVVSCTQ